MRDNRVMFKLIGVVLAIIGAVIVIHIVPVVVWYAVLILLVLVFAYILLNT